MVAVKFKLRGFKKMEVMLRGSKFRAAFRPVVQKATGKNALLSQAAIRKSIKSNVPPRNADLTAAIKGSTGTLRDHGDLFGSVTHKVLSPTTAFAGILRTDDMYNIGLTLHEGATISVTPRMRAMFFVLWLASKGQVDGLDGRAAELFERHKDWKPLKKSTDAIRIPARPFVTRAFENDKLKKRIVTNWKNAVEEALKKARQ